MVLAVAHPWASASSYLSSQSLADSHYNLHASCHLAVVPLSLVVLSPVASSSVASPSSASSCDAAAACRSLALAASFAFRRSSALLPAYFGPSSLSSSPRARTTLLTPTAIICRQVISLLRSALSSNTCTSTDDAGAGFPFGCRSPGFRLAVHVCCSPDSYRAAE